MKDLKSKFKEHIEKLNLDAKIKKHIVNSYELKFHDKDNELIALIEKEQVNLADILQKETDKYEKKVAGIKHKMENQKDIIINNELQKRLKSIVEFYVIDINKDTQ
jgi:hypothetical protein